MKIYAVRGDYKKFAGLRYEDERVASSLYDHSPGTLLAPEWENFEVIKGTGNDGFKMSRYPVGNFAFLQLSSRDPTFGEEAKNVLEPHIARYGEFLPLRHGS